jgi:pyruvate dehydrogenase E2 component (dihydrolipoamide acetyltransferase)
MARDLNVELGSLQGSGPGGRIVKADVEAAAGEEKGPPAGKPADGSAEGPPVSRSAAAAPAPEGAKGEVEVLELNRLQQTVARRMSESKATVPHFYLETEIDMTEAVKVRGELKQIAGDAPAPTFNDMIVKACALALRQFPRANGAYRDGRVELHARVNVGVAVAAQDALVVPTVFDADRKSLGEIAAETRALAEKVRDGKITPPELSGGTFTVSNLGMFGVTNFSAVINPPQAALLAIGALEPKPAADRESRRVVVRDTMGVTLACDHRILYGADGARFLARIRELLERPLSMAL